MSGSSDAAAPQRPRLVVLFAVVAALLLTGCADLTEAAVHGFATVGHTAAFTPSPAGTAASVPDSATGSPPAEYSYDSSFATTTGLATVSCAGLRVYDSPGESSRAGIVAVRLRSATEDTVAVIGRQADTAVAKDWAGHEVLDLPANEWTIAKNDQWVQSVIDRKMSVYVGSPTTWSNLWDAAAGRTTVFGRELKQFTNARYTWDGWTMIPPGG